MPAYVIVQVEITDDEKYDRYKALTPDTIRRYEGKFIVRGGRSESLEGDWTVERLVILEFPSYDRAKEWYRSPEYQAAKAVREGGANMVFTLVEGFDGIA